MAALRTLYAHPLHIRGILKPLATVDSGISLADLRVTPSCRFIQTANRLDRDPGRVLGMHVLLAVLLAMCTVPRHSHHCGSSCACQLLDQQHSKKNNLQLALRYWLQAMARTHSQYWPATGMIEILNGGVKFP
jgi:hypothetical protein